jgi:hypothetical protein
VSKGDVALGGVITSLPPPIFILTLQDLAQTMAPKRSNHKPTLPTGNEEEMKTPRGEKSARRGDGGDL